ncbi:MAG: hypothetical protein II171_03970, partial [Bacteroidales bacterium]|nr:hypothetical protein [Bacteroidales bacterium]
FGARFVVTAVQGWWLFSRKVGIFPANLVRPICLPEGSGAFSVLKVGAFLTNLVRSKPTVRKKSRQPCALPANLAQKKPPTLRTRIWSQDTPVTAYP